VNLYGFVKNSSIDYIDLFGLVDCKGKCGAIIDDWIVQEVNAQIAGYSGDKNIDEYLKWANGNQRYKDDDFFKFNKETSCGTWATGASEGCGRSVTLCGKCIRSAILGNIMYGIIAAKHKLDLIKVIARPSQVKEWPIVDLFVDVSPNDVNSYMAGIFIGQSLERTVTLVEICESLDIVVKSDPKSILESRKDGGFNSLASCDPCTERTKEKRHGGKEKPRFTP
jgi:hypothetical protein